MYIRLNEITEQYEEFDMYQWHVIGDMQYSPGWFLQEDWRERFSIYEVVPTIKPSVSVSQKAVRQGFIKNEESQWVENWVVVDKSEEELAQEAAALVVLKSQLMNQIDDTVAAIYARFQRFYVEYIVRIEKAKAFKNAEYQGDPTIWITSFADAKGLDYQTATDIIIDQAASADQILETVGATRMSRYSIENATSVTEANSIFYNIYDVLVQAGNSLS